MCIRDRAQGQLQERQQRRDQPQLGEHPAGLRERDRRRRETCLLYTSDAADERSSVDLGGRRTIKKKTNNNTQARYRILSSDYHRIDLMMRNRTTTRQYTAR